MVEDKLVNVYIAKSQIDAMIAKSMLEAADIKYCVKGENIQELAGIGSFGTFNIIFGPIRIFVLDKDAEEARKVLQPLTEEAVLEEKDNDE